MATNFPTSLDNLTNPAGSDPVNNPSHATQHANINDAIEVLETKVGVNNSTITTSLDYRVKQLETTPTYTNEMAQDAVATALAAGTHTNITINYNDTGNSISISAAAGYTNEEAVDAVALALTAGSGISISYNDSANTITISVDSTIATKTYVDTAVSNLGSTAASTYVLDSEVGQPDGIATLDLSGQVPFSQLGNLVNSAPATLDTLNELATALGNDANFATTTATSIGNKVSKAGGDIITSSLASTIPLRIKGVASQTANLQEWQDSGGTQLGFFNAYGTLTANNRIYAGWAAFGSGYGTLASASNVVLIAKGSASQTANLQEWQNSAGTVLAAIEPTGSFYGSSITSYGILTSNSSFRVNNASASTVATIIKGAASQTANLQEWQNSSGTMLANVSSSGQFLTPRLTITNGGNIVDSAGTTPYFGFGSNQIAIYTRNAAYKGLVVQGSASQTANLQEWQNSAGTVLASINSSGVLASNGTIQVVGVQSYNGVGSYTIMNYDTGGAVTFTNGAANKGLIIKGAASQTANLQEWQNSTGTAIAKIDASGAMFTITPAANTNTTQVATTAFVQSEIDTSVQPGAVYQTSAPSSPAVGQIWIDSDEDVTTFDSNIIRRKAITATAGQTVFTADLPFIDGFEQIFMNGLLLVKTTDYATSGGNTVTLTSGAAASDVIEIVSVTGANSIETYTQAETNALLAANTSVAPLSISANTTLVAKKRYFVTSASALTLTLPASPALNDEIQILDASGNSSTYNITVARNANKINGDTVNLIIDTNGVWVTLLYTGSTYGWKVG